MTKYFSQHIGGIYPVHEGRLTVLKFEKVKWHRAEKLSTEL